MAVPRSSPRDAAVLVARRDRVPLHRREPAPAPGRNAGLRPAAGMTDLPSRQRLRAEILIVLGLSFGLSALYSIVSVLDKATRPEGIAGQTTSINPVLNQRELFDFLYRILDIVGQLMPVALVVFLLWQTAKPHLGRLGVDFTRPGRDALQGLGLAVLIGAGGLLVYVLGRATGLTADVVASSAPALVGVRRAPPARRDRRDQRGGDRDRVPVRPVARPRLA